MNWEEDFKERSIGICDGWWGLRTEEPKGKDKVPEKQRSNFITIGRCIHETLARNLQWIFPFFVWEYFGEEFVMVDNNPKEEYSAH